MMRVSPVLGLPEGCGAQTTAAAVNRSGAVVSSAQSGGAVGSALLASPLIVLGVILALGSLLGDAAERLRVPWITGCIVAGVLLGPAVLGVLPAPEQAVLAGFTQSSLAVIAFNIGSELAWTRLRTIGGGIVLLAVAQLLAPVAAVLAAKSLLGLALPVALVVAAVAAATAPTTTYSVIHRRNAAGPFVDRVLGILALNDAAAVLIFSAVSAAAVALLGAGDGAPSIAAVVSRAAVNEALSVAAGWHSASSTSACTG